MSYLKYLIENIYLYFRDCKNPQFLDQWYRGGIIALYPANSYIVLQLDLILRGIRFL
jgi:hypothetical protein